MENRDDGIQPIIKIEPNEEPPNIQLEPGEVPFMKTEQLCVSTEHEKNGSDMHQNESQSQGTVNQREPGNGLLYTILTNGHASGVDGNSTQVCDVPSGEDTAKELNVINMGIYGVVPFITDCKYKYSSWNSEMTQLEQAFKKKLIMQNCRICEASGFKTAKNLFLHFHSHNNSAIYCTICQSRFSQIRSFATHAEKHKTHNFHCRTCCRLYQTKDELKLHKLEHRCPRDTKFTCEKCPQLRLLDFKSLSKHILKCYKIEICKKCGAVPKNHDCASFKKPDDFWKNSKNDKAYDCGLCPKKLENLSKLQAHRRIHIIYFGRPSPQQAEPCLWCGMKVFSNWYYYCSHLKSHTNSTHHCSICHYGFKSEKATENHLIKHVLKFRQCKLCKNLVEDMKEHWKLHRGKPPFQCDFCKKTFPTYKKLKADITSHLATTTCPICNQTFNSYLRLNAHSYLHKKKFKCKKCKKVFGRKDYLKKHMLSHSKKRIFKCPICLNRFSRSDNFKAHLERMHKTNEKFACICGKSFQHKRSYAIHRAHHRGAQYFECHFCHVQFRQFIKLKIHIQGKHLNIPMHSCDICGKQFLKNESFVFHYENKHGKLNSICDVCGNKFDSYVQLVNHEKTHRMSTFSCETCSKTFDSKQELCEHNNATHSVKRQLGKTQPGKVYSCYNCDKRSYSFTAIKRHIEQVHLINEF